MTTDMQNEESLRRLVAEAEIRRTVALLPQQFDAREAGDLVMDAFIEESELRLQTPARRFAGRSDLVAGLAELNAIWDRTASFVGNVAVEWADEVAVVTSYLQVWAWTPETAAGGVSRPADVVYAAACEDLVVLEGGRWRIKRRCLTDLVPGARTVLVGSESGSG